MTSRRWIVGLVVLVCAATLALVWVLRDPGPGSGAGISSADDPDLDEMLDRGRRTSDFNERKQIYDDIQKLLMDDLVPWLVTFNYNQYWPAQQHIQGYKVMPSISRIYLREVWTEKQ